MRGFKRFTVVALIVIGGGMALLAFVAWSDAINRGIDSVQYADAMSTLQLYGFLAVICLLAAFGIAKFTQRNS